MTTLGLEKKPGAWPGFGILFSRQEVFSSRKVFWSNYFLVIVTISSKSSDV